MWKKTAADRQRDAAVYGDPEYLRNRALAKRRAGGYCERCKHKHPRLQCDHKIPGGGHALDNLQMLCVGDLSCKCHERKTAGEDRKHRTPPDPSPRPRTDWT